MDRVFIEDLNSTNRHRYFRLGAGNQSRPSASTWRWSSTSAKRRHPMRSTTRWTTNRSPSASSSFVEDAEFQLVEALAERCAAIVLD